MYYTLFGAVKSIYSEDSVLGIKNKLLNSEDDNISLLTSNLLNSSKLMYLVENTLLENKRIDFNSVNQRFNELAKYK